MATVSNLQIALARLKLKADMDKVIEMENQAIINAKNNPVKTMQGINNFYVTPPEETTVNDLETTLDAVRSIRLSYAIEDSAKNPAVAIKLFPLYEFIWLYHTAKKSDVYTDNMAGAKVLANWLAPFSSPEIDPVELAKCRIACMYHTTYEMNELAKILDIEPEIILWCLMN